MEIGTSIGYSAISMAEILNFFEGHITTIEFDETVSKQANLRNIKNTRR
ncbi:MAG: hypothetical protein GYA51_12885 [Candidatus Methanofastidiosa archaeon]|nr:hypothetical protein [Candidatus Methanofastidiosa archaeon]